MSHFDRNCPHGTNTFMCSACARTRKLEADTQTENKFVLALKCRSSEIDRQQQTINALKKALERALADAHHKDGCRAGGRTPCTCWRENAFKVLAAIKATEEKHG